MFLRMVYDEKLAEAAYVIGCQRTGEAIVIDPERDVDRYEAEKNPLSDLIDRPLREVTPGRRGAGPEESRLRALQRRPIARVKMAAPSSAHIASYRDEPPGIGGRSQTKAGGGVGWTATRPSHRHP